MFPVRYELNSYINLLRNSVFKGLKRVDLSTLLSNIKSFYMEMNVIMKYLHKRVIPVS
jgi:hypothetical protein